MKATVDAKEFSRALDMVSKAIHKSAVLILEEALVRFSGGRCTITGTDFDTWLSAELPAQGDDFAFVFHRTANVAKACRRFDGGLTFELTETGEGRNRRLKLHMSCGHREGELNAFFPEDYPELPKLEPEHSFTVNAAHLLDRIGRIKYATVKPGPNTNVLSTSIQFSGSRIFCLDGARAAWDSDDLMNIPEPFVAPAASLEYLKLFGDQDVSVQLGNRYIDISDGTLHLRLRRVAAAIFDLDSAIPRQSQEEIYVYPKDFLTELAYLRELAPAARKSVVQFDSGRLFMQVDGCSYQTRIEIDGHSEIAIGFSLNYLTDALRQFKAEPRVRIKLNSPISPVVLEAEGRSDCALVLPVKLRALAAA